jgi:cytochrome-b5 reductase
LIEWVSCSAKYDQVYWIGAGNGITPLWGYLTDNLNYPVSETKLRLICSNKSEKDIVFMDEITRLKAQYPGIFEIVYVLEKASEVAKYTGRLTDEILK